MKLIYFSLQFYQFLFHVFWHSVVRHIYNKKLDESQARIKTAGRNSNNLRYAADTTLMAESEKELKSLKMRVKKLA